MKKQFILIIALVLLSQFGFQSAEAKLIMTYNKMALKDLDEMNEFVHLRIKDSRKNPEEGSLIILKETWLAVYARPNEDGMIRKVIGPLKTEIDQRGNYQKTIEGLIDEVIGYLKSPDNLSPQEQVSYLVFLENVIAEFKPNLSPDNFEFIILKKISDSEIKVTKKAHSERKLRMMDNKLSPSEISEKVLKSIEEVQKNKSKTQKSLDKKNNSDSKSEAEDVDSLTH